MKGSLFVLSLSTLLLLCSCGGGGLRTDLLEVSGETGLPGDSLGRISIQLSLEYPVSGASKEALDNITYSIVDKAIVAGPAWEGIDKAASDYLQESLSQYEAQMLAFKENHEEDWFGADWEDSIAGYFTGSYRGVSSYIVESYSYGGMAGGLEEISAINFNEKTGEVIPEDEYFRVGYYDDLSSVLSYHLEEDTFSSREDYDALFVKDIEPNGNFYLTEDGVTFIYSPLALGPRSLGSIRVSIPWEEALSLVDPKYR